VKNSRIRITKSTAQVTKSRATSQFTYSQN